MDRCRLRWIVGIATLVTLLSRKVSCFKVPITLGRTCDHDRERHRHQAGNHRDRAGCRAVRRSIVEKLLLLWCWIAYAIAAKVLPRGRGHTWLTGHGAFFNTISSTRGVTCLTCWAAAGTSHA